MLFCTAALSSLRAPLLLRPAVSAARPLSTTPTWRSDEVPIWTGVGAKPGEMPTQETQATGVERLEWEALKQGINLFDYQPL